MSHHLVHALELLLCLAAPQNLLAFVLATWIITSLSAKQIKNFQLYPCTKAYHYNKERILSRNQNGIVWIIGKATLSFAPNYHFTRTKLTIHHLARVHIVNMFNVFTSIYL